MEYAKEVNVKEYPRCDYCGYEAYYDAKTKVGQWAFMCEKHWKENAYSKFLGMGLGQKLILERDS